MSCHPSWYRHDLAPLPSEILTTIAARCVSNVELIPRKHPFKSALLPGIRPQTHKVTKSDPVALYNNYQKDWAKFKNRIPIDNKHLDLRWAVRARLSSRLSD